MKNHEQLNQETKAYNDQHPQLRELWQMRKDSRVATLIGINAVREVANLRGFTDYCERVLEDLDG